MSDSGIRERRIAFESSNIKPDWETWVIPGWRVVKSHDHLMYQNRLYCFPIFVPERTLYYKMGAQVRVPASAGSKARLGIYNWKDGLPDSLIIDAGTIATDAIGWKELTINLTLNRGYYFIAFVINTAAEFYGPELTGCFPCVTGVGDPGNNNVDYFVLDLEDAGGLVDTGLPDPAPAALKDGYQYLDTAVVKLCTHL